MDAQELLENGMPAFDKSDKVVVIGTTGFNTDSIPLEKVSDGCRNEDRSTIRKEDPGAPVVADDSTKETVSHHLGCRAGGNCVREDPPREVAREAEHVFEPFRRGPSGFVGVD